MRPFIDVHLHIRDVDYRALFPKPDKCLTDINKREGAPIGKE